MSLPITAIIDPQIQTNLGLTKQTGPDIGAEPPADYGFVQGLPGRPTGVLYYVEGTAGKYQDWLSACKRPYLPNSGNLQLGFDLILDSNYLKIAQALEYDTVVCIGGWNYLFGFQILPNKNLYQISGQDQIGWQATNSVDLSSVVPNIPVHLTFNYKFDVNSKIYSFISFSINDSVIQIPLNQQNLKGINKNWTDHAILQIQLDTNQQAGRYSEIIDNAYYAWY